MPKNFSWRFWEKRPELTPEVHEEANAAPAASHEFNTDIRGAWLNAVSVGKMPFDIKNLRAYLRNPEQHIKELREWSHWAYYANGTIASGIDALGGIHTLEYVVTARPKKDGVDPGGYGKYVTKMNSVLDYIKYKQVLRDAIHRCAMDGLYVAYFETRRSSGNKKDVYDDTEIYSVVNSQMINANVMVIPLPVDYVKIIGRRNNCYEIAFDLRYFEQFHDDETRKRYLAGYPKQIQDGFAKYIGDGEDAHKPWLRLDWRKTIVKPIKSTQSNPTGIPFAIAAMDDVDFADYFVNTKRGVLDSVNSYIYYQTFPEGREKGTSALTKVQQEAQHNVVKNALASSDKKGTSFFSLAAGTKFDFVPRDTSILDEKNEEAIKEDVNEDLGFSAAALSGSSSGNYATATLNMEIVAGKVFTWIEDVVEELNKCLNYSVMRNSDYKVRFTVLPITFVNRDKMVKQASDLYARGKGSLTMWIAAAGFNPDEYLSLMEYELAQDFENKFPVHKTSFTVTGKDAPDTDVDGSGGGENPSTESTNTNGGNANPSPSDT